MLVRIYRLICGARPRTVDVNRDAGGIRRGFDELEV
jgi:hypothetical protein